MNFRRLNCLQMPRNHCQKISSLTSVRVQVASNEYSRKDFCTELVHSTSVFWWYGIEFYFCSKWNDRPIEWWIEPSIMKWLAICEWFLHMSEKAVTLHCFCPPASLQSRLTQHWRSSFFHSSYSWFSNSICFGSARRWSLMITSLRKLWLLPESCQHKWILGFSSRRWYFLRFLCVSWALFGLAWITLNPSRRQVLHDHFVFVMQSKVLFFIQNLVVCCDHSPISFGNLNFVRPIVRIVAAWRPCNFRASVYFAIRVFGMMSE